MTQIAQTAINYAGKFNVVTVAALNFEVVNFVERLNAMIAAGASFDVSADDFQIFGADNSTETEKQFLTVNKPLVLCTLQQSLLMKYLPLDSIPDYLFEVKERIAVLTDGGEPSPELYFETVRDVTKEWFADVLDEMSDPVSTFIN